MLLAKCSKSAETKTKIKRVVCPRGTFHTALTAEYLFQHFSSKRSILRICSFGGRADLERLADRRQKTEDGVEKPQRILRPPRI